MVRERSLIDFVKSMARDVDNLIFDREGKNITWHIKRNDTSGVIEYNGYFPTTRLEVNISKTATPDMDYDIEIYIKDYASRIEYTRRIGEKDRELLNAMETLTRNLDIYMSEELDRTLNISNLGKFQC